jgi:predicted nucleotidyltransferase
MGECLLAVCLYGSLARGQAHQGSDVDLFIVVQGKREEAGKIKRAPAFYFEIDISPEEARRAARGAAEVLQLGLDLKARPLPGAEAEEESPSQRQGKE